MDQLVLKCRNPECDPNTDLIRFEISTAKMSMWECPKCKSVYFFSHADKQLSATLKPKPEA